MSANDGFRVRSLTKSVYLPSLLFAIGQGAVIPFIALIALDLGASVALSGAIVALRGVGLMIFDVPAGVLVAKIGERRAMIGATAVLAVIAVAIWRRPPLAIYAVLVTAMGCAWAVWSLARISFATEAAPRAQRGRVMSMIGGMARVGHFVGPLIGGLTVISFGLGSSFVIQAVLCLAAAVTLWIAPAPSDTPTGQPPGDEPKMRRVLGDNRRVLATAGTFALASQVVRSSREAIIPLWGTEIGASPSSISFIFGASAAMELLLFYPVGFLMDRRGRKWAAIPSLTLLAIGVAAIPLTSTVLGLTVLGLLLGLANGIGAGMNMTIGSDLSPALGRNQFLGLWRLTSDVGTASGPLLVAVTTVVASLATAAVVVGGIGLVGVGVLWLAVPETLHLESDDP